MTSSSRESDDWTPDRLQSLITDQIPEDFRLDFKGADSLPLPKMLHNVREEKRRELGKDATAFANSDGGVIVYGIRESKRLDGRSVPERFDPVSTADVSRDQIAQIIAAHSEPTLVGVRIFPVQVPGQDDPGKVCYVVVVPKCDTAHMASDGRYYYRNEATTERMRDWQVRDAMNRRRYPDLDLEIEITGDHFTGSGYRRTLQVRITNIGTVIAKNFCAVVHFPLVFGGIPLDVHEEGTEDHHIAVVPDGKGYHWLFTNREDGPLFPKRTVRKNAYFQFADFMEDRDFELAGLPSIEDVRITLYADEMPAKVYRCLFETGLHRPVPSALD